MSFSVNEIENLARKAAVGAGFPPEQARRFGRVAAIHLAHGGSEAPLLAALRDPADSPILRLPLLVDDVLRASEAMGDDLVLSMHPGDAALAPAYVATLPRVLKSCGVDTSGDQPRISLTLGAPRGADADMPDRITLGDDARRHLQRLARNTEVPATEASRLRGAGAGVIDRD